MRKLILTFILLAVVFTVNSQNQNSFSIHKQQLDYYNQLKFNRMQLDSMHHFVSRSTKTYEGCALNKVVFGWFPYWQGSTYQNFEWDLLSDLSYFSYDVDPSSGNATSTHGWSTTAVVDSAQAHGVRVNLCATLFSSHATFFGNSTSEQTLIDNLITLVQQRNANGVNIDFEGVPSSQATNFTNFLVDLCTQMHSQIPGSQVSIALYAVDWGNVFDEPVLNNYLDYFIIMGYDYYYGGSATAGPNDPLYPFTTTGYNLSRSINYFLDAGISKEKLVLGLPYYGFDWPTTSSALYSSTTASASTKLYNTVMNNSSGYYSSANKHWDENSMTTYWVYNDGSNWHQCFVDDANAMSRRLDLINQIGIAGMGIWALGYDDGYTDMWDLIAQKFSTCGWVECSDTIWDNGGPNRDYYSNTDYTYTIQPTNASGLTLTFNSLDLESGYDSLWIYDGTDINAPLIASLSGNTIPSTIVASSNALTLQFHSDVSTVGTGWEAIWQCIIDNQPPTTDIIANDWYSTDFTASFNDQDNDSVAGCWFNYACLQNSNWYSYRDSGYFYDAFTSQPDTAWTIQVGTWQNASGFLEQTDEVESNTNYYIPVNQNLSQSVVYSWQMKITGAGTNRRGGIHFYCDDATLTNRNNSYMVYFRVDQDKVQIYKSVNDVITLETDDDCTVNDNQLYDCTVIFDKTTGTIDVYQDGILVSTWTDSSPFTTGGDFVSLRTGNADVSYRYFNILSKRTDTTYHFVLNGQDAFNVFSMVRDASKNISTIASKIINIDVTSPILSGPVRDGNDADIDSIFINTEYFANWHPATEIESAISGYKIALGTQPYSDNIVAWFDNGTDTTAYLSGLNLLMDTTYYFSVIAQNLAGLYSDTVSSDGALMTIPLSPPQADFNYSDSLICQTYSVNFIENSTQGQSFNWIFEGGNPSVSTDATPTVTYPDTGFYDVAFIVSNSMGADTLILQNAIHVYGLPVSDFEAIYQTGQLPFTAYFVNHSTNADYYQWLFETANGEDVSSDYEPYHIYNDTGCFNVTLITTEALCPNYSDTLLLPDYICVTTDIQIQNEESEINLMPNPVNEKLYLKFSGKYTETLTLKVYNALNEQVLIRHIEQPNGKYTLNTGELPSGTYFLILSSKNQTWKTKFVKVKTQ